MYEDCFRALEELDDDEFIDESDKRVFERYISDPSAVLMEMACVRGKDVKPTRLPFSFYFSDREAVHSQHGIRVKVTWNPMKINSSDADGFFIIHGKDFPYKWVPGSHKYKPTAKELKNASMFIRNNKVLFAAVWEGVLHQNDLQHYFEGFLSWKDLLKCFHTGDMEGDSLIQVSKDVEDLEQTVREENLFNMND